MRIPTPAAVALVLLAAPTLACPAPAPPPVEPEPPPRPPEPPPRPPEPPPVVEEEPIYPMDDALADALSGPLVHLGTGPWHGIATMYACAYRNERVLVVNVYCTVKPVRAFRVDVFSPTRGRVSLYAEAETAPIAGKARAEYFTFKGESEPPATSGLAPVRLDMGFDELAAYDARRYDRFLSGCWGGDELRKPQGGCLHELAPLAGAFAARNDGFFAQPPADWFRLVDELSARAPADRKTAPARRGR